MEECKSDRNDRSMAHMETEQRKWCVGTASNDQVTG